MLGIGKSEYFFCRLNRIGLVSVLGAVMTFAPTMGATSAQAMPSAMPTVHAQSSAIADVCDNVHNIQRYERRKPRSRDWRRRHWRGHRDYYDDDWNPTAFIAGGVIGALLSQGYSESRANTAMQRCADRFNSFEWFTGLYTTYGGEKRLCPYLR